MNGLKWIACAAVITGGVALTSQAKAEVQLAADFDVAVPVNAPDNTRVLTTTGAGFDGRLGFRFRIPRTYIGITPELAVGYTGMDATFVRVRPGVRFGVGKLVIPYVYGHIGWGWTSYNCDGANGSVLKRSDAQNYMCLDETGKALAKGERGSGQGAAFDVGIGLDVHPVRHFSMGAHIGYNAVNVSDPNTLSGGNTARYYDQPKWFNFGLNATVHF